jgi:cathepsin L
MKFLVCLVFLAVLNSSMANLNNPGWTQFKSIHKKSYSSSIEEQTRFSLWSNNTNKIADHNLRYSQGHESYTIGANQFSDLSFEEFTSKFTGSSHGVINGNHQKRNGVKSGSARTLPTSVDLRNTGYVGAVKNQGSCGSCWAFSAVAALEGAYYKKNGKSIILSEQNLVDCSSAYGNYGCNGGMPGNAFNYVIGNKGIDTSSSYPYAGVTQSCRYNKATIGTTETNWYIDASYGSVGGNEAWLQNSVATIGPISVAIYVNNNFMYYTSGVYKDSTCMPGYINHAVTVVGYGTDAKAGPYWIVRNSWGNSWGLSGYIYMARNNGNQCYISSFSAYPTS